MKSDGILTNTDNVPGGDEVPIALIWSITNAFVADGSEGLMVFELQ